MRPMMSLLLGSVVLASACAERGQQTRADYYEGAWRQEGYGRVLQIGNSRQQVYDVTERSCLPVYDKGAGPQDGIIFARDYETLDRIRVDEAKNWVEAV